MELINRQAIIAKIETTEGTDAAPTGEANAIWVGNISVVPIAGGTNERQLLYPDFGNTPESPKDKHLTVQFDTELVGSGTAGVAPAWGALARMCGWKETITADTSVAYDLISAGFESGSIYAHIGGTRHKYLGGRGEMGIIADKNSIPILRFQFTGRWSAAAAASFPTLTLDIDTPRLEMNSVNTQFSLHGYSAVLENLQLNTGNTVIHRDRPNAEYVAITGRKAGGTVLFEAPAIGTKDFFAIAASGALGALSWAHGTEAGNIVSLAAAACQVLEPSYQNVDGIQHIQGRLKPTRDNDNGDGDWSITLT